MNGEPFLVVTFIPVFLWFTGSSGQDANGNCLLFEVYCPKTKTCDGILNSECANSVCKELKMPCDNMSKCYRLSDRCDQVADCKDGVDELHCNSYRTPSYIKCILTKKCDHITTTTSTTTTRPVCSFYSCDLGQTCYYEYEKCNGIATCRDQRDELDCGMDCGSRFRCDDGNGCYASFSRCDDYRDCSDGSDETDCSTGSSGLSVGPIAGVIVFVIIVTVLVVCLKSVKKNASRRESPGAVAYHTAANYREANSMFQSSHTHNNNNSGSSQSNPRSTSSGTSANGYGGHSPYATGYGSPTATTTAYPPQASGPENFQQSDPSRLPYPYPVSVDSSAPESPPFAPPPAYETLFPQK